MAWVRLILPVLACVLLAAHFYRAQQLPLALLCALLPLLLAVPRAWAVRVLQVALVLGAIEWLRTLAAFSAERIAMGQPYLRLTLILLAVAAFTAASALVFRHERLRRRYRLGGLGDDVGDEVGDEVGNEVGNGRGKGRGYKRGEAQGTGAASR